MLVKDRPNLTRQALQSIYHHTARDQFNLMIMDDNSGAATKSVIFNFYGIENSCHLVSQYSRSIGVLGFLRNVGAQVSEKVFGRGDWLCFLDNDVAVFEGWLPNLIHGANFLHHGVLGGQRHPYHQVSAPIIPGRPILEVDAVAGYSMFMSWSTWDRFGPFDANAKGIGQSEDWAFSQRVKKGGGIVGYIHPHVLAHLGVTYSLGKPATGHEAFERFPGLIYE